MTFFVEHDAELTALERLSNRAAAFAVGCERDPLDAAFGHVFELHRQDAFAWDDALEDLDRGRLGRRGRGVLAVRVRDQSAE